VSDGARYLAFLRAQPCAVQPCVARSEAHHSTNAPAAQHEKSIPGAKRGKSQRADDAHAFPLCTKHHAEFHDARGFFEGWDRAQRASWQDFQVSFYRGKYESALTLPVLTETPALTPRPTLRQYAEQFAAERELGPQVAFDLQRLLEQLEREGAF
jgi:hypothetical protein